jgi:peptidoglycan/LPS O-acetylase OafA/YrhL
MTTQKRPFAVTCLIGLVLTLSGLQALRLWVVLSSWDYLISLPLTITPIYFAVSTLVWLALGGSLVWGLWRAKAWAPRIICWAVIAFTAVHWLDRLFLQAKGSQNSNWPFDLILSLVLVASVFAVLSLPKVRVYFGEPHE